MNIMCVTQKCLLFSYFFFFKQKTAYEMRISDWSSDVCSSDLGHAQRQQDRPHHRVRQGARAGVSGTQERVEIKAPSGRVAAEFTPYSAEAARALEADLRASLGMAVNFGAQSRALFATDASNYRQVPIGVVTPRSRDEVIETVRHCRQHDAPRTEDQTSELQSL